MSRYQRQKAQRRLVTRAVLDEFVERPCRLTLQQTQALLNELCGTLGYCLTPADSRTIEADPPTNPQAFAERVVELEGGGPLDPESFQPVLELVLATFEGVARQRKGNGR